MHDQGKEDQGQYLSESNRGEQSMAPQSEPPERSGRTMPESELGTMSIATLIVCCRRELHNYRRGDLSSDRYGVELLRRAIVERNSDAWAALQECFGEIVCGWIHSHPRTGMAIRLDSEENYIAQAFARFWQATAHNRKLTFNTLATALAYLRACLTGAILDTLRAYSRPKELQVWTSSTFVEEPEDEVEHREVWTVLLRMFPKPKEQRLLYLFFHCGLKPREIIQHCPGEFTDVQEIYRLHRNILDRLSRNADQLRWLLGDDRESI